MEVILDIEIRFTICFISRVFIDFLVRWGIGGVNVVSLKVVSLLSSGIVFFRKFNLVLIMN